MKKWLTITIKVFLESDTSEGIKKGEIKINDAIEKAEAFLNYNAPSFTLTHLSSKKERELEFTEKDDTAARYRPRRWRTEEI